PMDLNTLHRKEVLITGSEGRSEEDFYRATKLISFNKIDVGDIISKIYPIDDVKEATEHALSGKTYRVLLKM
ncbi:MAG: alanine dehydrogenase, partial [Spirochaetaceae bacterium]|nr:alanine dehydrogenase [Spirochaetaceae bacterium]